MRKTGGTGYQLESFDIIKRTLVFGRGKWLIRENTVRERVMKRGDKRSRKKREREREREDRG